MYYFVQESFKYDMTVPNELGTSEESQIMPRKTRNSTTMDHFVVSIVDMSELKGHERTEEARLNALKAEIESDGVLIRPIVVDEKTNVVLDGHHRIEALSLLGCSKIPVCYVNYDSRRIGVLSRTKGLEMTKFKVVKAALRDEPFPPKTTWHYITSSRTLNHISCIQRPVNIPLTHLK